MKLITLFLIMGMSVYATSNSYSQSTLLSVKAKNKTVKEVFKELEKQSEYVIFYYDGVVDASRKVSVSVDNQTVDKILDEIFKGTDNTYTIEDRQIVISKKQATQSVAENTQNPAKRTVTGKVLDETNLGLPGVTISISGSSRGVVTDVDGSYKIDVKPGDKLVFSYIGYSPQTIPVGDKTVLNVSMKPKEDELKEVVVVGYGSQRKESVIGSIVSVSADNLHIPVGKLSSSLAGQMAGVVALQRSGEPGAGGSFWIRGVNTFGANNTPLVLVDGVERSMDLVDFEDIETFSVLKDATATAVYGVKGANGVILITTRKGKEGKLTVNVRAEYGIMSPTIMPKMANAEQFMTVFNEVSADVDGVPFYTPERMAAHLNGSDPDLYPNVDWLDEIYKDVTTSQRISLNVTGGSDKVRYYVSGLLYNENGIYNAQTAKEYNPSIKWTKYNFRSNIDINLHRTTVLGLNIANQFDVKNTPNADQLWIYSFLTIPVAIPKYYSTGQLARPQVGANPYNMLNNTGYSNVYNTNTQALMTLTQDFSELITPGLQANIKFSWDTYTTSAVVRSKNPATYHISDPTKGRNPDGTLNLVLNDGGSDYITLGGGNTLGDRTMYLEASVTYNRVFANKHRVGALALYNMRERTDSYPANSAAKSENQLMSAYELGFPYTSLGMAARATYAYDDKYFIEGNFGYNGSENFSPDKRFGFFPSVALGYMISNEKYFEPIRNVVSLLKIRASIGKIGNDQIGGGRRFAYNATMNTKAGGYSFGETGSNYRGGIATGYPGSNVSWEEALKKNAGIEFELFRSLKFQIDMFHEKRNGIFISNESVSTVVGLNVRPFVNLGKMENKGIDITGEYTKQFGDLFVSGRANFSFNRNKVLYDDKPEPIYSYLSAVGKPLYQQTGLVYLGLFQSQDEIDSSPQQKFSGNVRVGDVKYLDINSDGVVDVNDKIPLGRMHVPEINYGAGLSLSYKGFDLSFFFQGVENITNWLDGSPVNGFEQGNRDLNNMFREVYLNRWTPENRNPNAPYPRMAAMKNENNKQLSTRNQRDMSFCRLKNAEIGYTFPRKWTKKAYMSTVRLYAQGLNLATFTKFKMWDVEIQNSQGAVYPNMRVINIGLNVNF